MIMCKENQKRLMTPSKLLQWALWIIIITILPIFYFQIAWGNPVDFQSGGLGAGDFKAYYVASRLLDKGENIYNVELQQNETDLLGYMPDATYYLYPSFLATLLIPLSRLPINQAALIWNTINLLLLAGTVWLLSQTFDLRNRLTVYYPWFVLLFFLAAPTTIALRIGQANIATLFFIAMCLWADQRGAAKLSGFALAIAILLKIFPTVLLIWFLWQKKNRTIIWFAVSITLLIITNAVLLALTGRNSLVDWYYLTAVLPSLQPPSQFDNHSLAGFLYRYEIHNDFIQIFLTSSIILFSGLSFLYAMSTKQQEIAFAILLCMTLLLTSITWTSTLIFLSIPIAVLLSSLKENGRLAATLLAVGVIYICINSSRTLFNIGIPIANYRILLSLPFAGLTVTWFALMYFASIKKLPAFPDLLS